MGPGCFSSSGYNINYDGTGSKYNIDGASYYYRFITADGMSIAVFSMAGYFGDCTNSNSAGITGDTTQVCSYLHVDVNGQNKPPNIVGRDLFTFAVTNGHGAKIYPYGGSDYNGNPSGNGSHFKNADGSFASCYSGNTVGWSCAGRVIEEGWQMNY